MHSLAAAFVLIAGLIQPEEAKRVRYEDLPTAAQLGVRVDAVRRAWPTSRCVVIVPNAAAYVEAIAGWSPALRFPVLIDDGSPAGREDIGRFVRGFGDARVVRWEGKPGTVAGKDAVDAALRGVWGKAIPGETAPPRVGSNEELIGRWRGANVPRTGIVIASEGDAGWTAALALSAGRAQPLAWIERPGGLMDARMERKALGKFEAMIEGACESTTLSWRALGDDIDAVTICMGTPSKVQADPTTVLATTDVLGRLDGTGKLGSGKRWAWVGQIAGGEARSAYLAMCALFLDPRNAWMFDGYPTSEPWSRFSMKEGVGYLERIGVTSEWQGSPKGNEASWRLRASRVVDAGLVLVNTKGMANEFFLEPGRCLPVDVPELRVPAILHLVHSWSALSPMDRDTLGGRWLERGVYAYLGSVDEPYLNAFVPSSIFVGRMVSKYPFAAAARPDDAAAWKLATFGDPLVTMGTAVPRVNEEPALEGFKGVREELAERLAKRELAAGLRLLVLLGDDAGLAKLASAMLREQKESLTSEAAEDCILPLFRAGDHAALGSVYGLLAPASAQRGELRDALWHVGFKVLPSTRDAALVDLFHAQIRPESRQRDAVELSEAFAAVHGTDAAAKMLVEQRSQLPSHESKQQIDLRIGQLRAGRR